MSNPKISGILNNCALYCAIPAIKTAIKVFSKKEQSGTLTDLVGAPTYENYALVKNCFAEFYSLDPKSFSWQQFQLLLTHTTGNNFVKDQLLLGSVLRLYMSKKIDEELSLLPPSRQEEIAALREFKQKIMTIQSNGTYLPLMMPEASKWLYQHLGLKTLEHQRTQYKNNVEWGTDRFGYFIEGTPAPCIEPEMAEIHIYHQQGHFELSNPGQLNVALSTEAKEKVIIDKKAPVLSSALKLLTKGDQANSQKALQLLKQFVTQQSRELGIQAHQMMRSSSIWARRYAVPDDFDEAEADKILSEFEEELTAEDRAEIDQMYQEILSDCNGLTSASHATLLGQPETKVNVSPDTETGEQVLPSI